MATGRLLSPARAVTPSPPFSLSRLRPIVNCLTTPPRWPTERLDVNAWVTENLRPLRLSQDSLRAKGEDTPLFCINSLVAVQLCTSCLLYGSNYLFNTGFFFCCVHYSVTDGCGTARGVSFGVRLPSVLMGDSYW